jgi:hypothetical protein
MEKSLSLPGGIEMLVLVAVVIVLIVSVLYFRRRGLK